VNKPALPKPKLEEGMVQKYEKPTGTELKDEANWRHVWRKRKL
jgi:hypothetical protein